MRRLRPRDTLHAYWREPDETNAARTYVDGAERSDYLVRLIGSHVTPGATVLEIGCNVGRNLHHLREASYQVAGVEISDLALDEMVRAYPDVAAAATLYRGAVEDRIRGVPEHDVVFSMAVLEHLHTDSDWVFGELARIARQRIVTVEDEKTRHWRVARRNYRKVFERLGCRQLSEEGCADIPGLGSAFVARVFTT